MALLTVWIFANAGCINCLAVEHSFGSPEGAPPVSVTDDPTAATEQNPSGWCKVEKEIREEGCFYEFKFSGRKIKGEIPNSGF